MADIGDFSGRSLRVKERRFWPTSYSLDGNRPQVIPIAYLSAALFVVRVPNRVNTGFCFQTRRSQGMRLRMRGCPLFMLARRKQNLLIGARLKALESKLMWRVEE